MLRLQSLCLLAALSVATTASAQIRMGQQGSVLLQGDVAFSYQSGSTTAGGTSTDHPTTTVFTLAPNGGYFVIDGLMIGARIGWVRRNTSPADSDDDTTTNTAIIGLVPAYYFPLRPSRALQLYVRGLLGYAVDSTETTSGGKSVTSSDSGYAVGGGVGLAFAFGGVWGGVIHLGLDFTHLGLSREVDGKSAELDISINDLTIGTGMGVYF